MQRDIWASGLHLREGVAARRVRYLRAHADSLAYHEGAVAPRAVPGSCPLLLMPDLGNAALPDQDARSGFQDNDSLARELARELNADLLVLLTNVDGLLDGDPRERSSKCGCSPPVMDEEATFHDPGAAVKLVGRCTACSEMTVWRCCSLVVQGVGAAVLL